MGSSNDDQRTVADLAAEDRSIVRPPTSAPTAVDRPGTSTPTVADRPGAIEPERGSESEPLDVDEKIGAIELALRPAGPTPTTTITTAAEAMRDEEVHRTRVFIRLGWVASIVGMGTIPFVDSPRTMTIAFVAALVFGMIVSFGYHQAFADPRRFTPRALLVLGVMSIINTHVAVMFFGAFTITPVLIVIGLHFIGRSELEVRRALYVTAAVCHAVIAVVLISGVMPDPGVFATGRDLGIESYVIGAIYVQAAYALAYSTGRSQRLVSLRSIEQLQRATRVASQRAALLEELRADLARAEQAGAGRYSDQVFGGFKLGAVVGRGAHGEVYEAVAEATGEAAAVKVLHREHLVDASQVARFLREATATTKISSPHVVRVLATSAPGAAVPFLAMERLRGLTLADLLRRKTQLTRGEVVTLVTQVSAGLDAARVAGIVHRDLKPQNLFFDDAIWKILDFGVATLTEHSGTLTQGGVVGTPHYMAPEQARAAKLDHRADLYALGVVAYRTLTGRNPFAGADTPAILYAVVHTMPPRPSALGELPVDVDRWMAIALAKAPDARFESGEAMAAALVAALRDALPAQLRASADRLIADAPWQELS